MARSTILLDDFGQYMKKLVAAELEALGKSPGDFVSIVQDGHNSSPPVTIQTPNGMASFTIDYAHLAYKTPKAELRSLIRKELLWKYRGS